MEFIPVMLGLSGKRVTIIGGGEVAYRKVGNLLPHCKEITVISSEFSEKFSGSPVEKIQVDIEDVRQVDEFLRQDDVVIIATDNTALNRDISEACRKRNILYNSVDDGGSSFIFPATFEDHGAVVSISTGGKSPSFARFMKDKIREEMSGYFPAVPVAERLRSGCGIKGFHERAEYFRYLFADENFWKLIFNGETETAYNFGITFAEKFRNRG